MLVTALLLLAAAPAGPQAGGRWADQAIPESIRAMLDAALESGNEGDINTVVKYARVADPASGDAVLRLATAWKADRDEKRREVIAESGWLHLWRGRVELGGFLTTGNSDTAGISANADLTREGLRWRHKLRGQIDYQESLGVTTREHYLASYEPNLKINDRAYLYGQAQYESDRFLGFYDRASVSLGAGYSAFRGRALTLDVELGPAFRYTEFTDQTETSAIAGRGSADATWRISPGLSLRETASAYVQRVNSTISSKTALNAKLIGPLSAQLSYNVQYESMPPVGSVSTDTTTRAALVYSF
jgi:putative salt-induced outer membrane protein